MGRRTAVAACAVTLVLVAAGCAPARPPAVVAEVRNPVTFSSDVSTPSLVVTASDATRRVVLWDDGADLLLDRFAAGSPVPLDAQPTTVFDFDRLIDDGWGMHDGAVEMGGGYALITADLETTGPHGAAGDQSVTELRNPANERVPLSGAAVDGGLCSPFESHMTDVAWNGSRFLLSKPCVGGTDQLFTVSTSGQVTKAASLAVPGGVTLSRSGGGFLATYVVAGPGGDADVRAQRLSATGAKVGGELDVASGPLDEFDPAVEQSGDANLVVWRSGVDDADLAARTVSTSGALGPVRTLSDAPGPQTTPTVTAGPSGTWFTAWTSAPGPDAATDVVGTKVLASGLPVHADGTTLAGGADSQDWPTLTRGPNGTAYLAWLDHSDVRFDGSFVPSEDLVRRLDTDGDPVGAATRSTRAPFPQTCADVAAGNGQYLVVWQESRVKDDPDVFARRYAPDGRPRGGLITLSAAAGVQSCPRAAWGTSGWLVVWTDRRNGAADVYGTTVSAAGAVAPANGFAVAAHALEQQRPSVAWDGTDFVVAWDDSRNGNHDVYAARVAPNRTVLDPNGIAVTTATGPQRHPDVASAGGRTLIAWSSSTRTQHRLLRANGTFVGGVIDTGPSYNGFDGQPKTVASPDRMGIAFNDHLGSFTFAAISPSTGTELSKTDLFISGSAGYSVDVAWDGERFVYRLSAVDNDTEHTDSGLGSITGTTVRKTDVHPRYDGAIASLPDGRSLVVGTRHTTLVLAAVDDAP